MTIYRVNGETVVNTTLTSSRSNGAECRRPWRRGLDRHLDVQRTGWQRQGRLSAALRQRRSSDGGRDPHQYHHPKSSGRSERRGLVRWGLDRHVDLHAGRRYDGPLPATLRRERQCRVGGGSSGQIPPRPKTRPNRASRDCRTAVGSSLGRLVLPADGSSDLHQKHFDSSGQETLGGDRIVNVFTTGSQLSSSVTALSDGGWLCKLAIRRAGQRHSSHLSAKI